MEIVLYYVLFIFYYIKIKKLIACPSNFIQLDYIYNILFSKDVYIPLIKARNKKAVGMNIKRLRTENYPEKQAIAIALNVNRKSGAKVKSKNKNK
jgi:hypothetical protein